jgi:predicted phosphoribosyltransferase
MVMEPYRDRRDAGQVLASLLRKYAGHPEVVVLALPRGGVPVGAEVARHLGVPLDVMVVRKLGVPGHRELAMGALASGGVRVLNDDLLMELGIPSWVIEEAVAQEAPELERREHLYRGSRPPLEVAGRTVLLVDDGVATGASMRAAVAALRQREPKRLVVAVPVAAAESCEELANEVDELVCARTPERFLAVGLWYEDFSETADEEVRAALEEAAQPAMEGAR